MVVDGGSVDGPWLSAPGTNAGSRKEIAKIAKLPAGIIASLNIKSQKTSHAPITALSSSRGRGMKPAFNYNFTTKMLGAGAKVAKLIPITIEKQRAMKKMEPVKRSN